MSPAQPYCDRVMVRRARIEAARSAISRLTQPRSVPREVDLTRSALEGKKVCFTGELRARAKGNPLTREDAHELAEKAGLLVATGVTKALDLLVVADPATMSSKAKKAREYGVRIVAEQVFWQAIGVALD